MGSRWVHLELLLAGVIFNSGRCSFKWTGRGGHRPDEHCLRGSGCGTAAAHLHPLEASLGQEAVTATFVARQLQSSSTQKLQTTGHDLLLTLSV